MKSKRLLLLGLLTLTVFLSSCRLVLDTTVHPDGSGELREALVYESEVSKDQLQKLHDESKSICRHETEDSVPEGAKFTEELHNGEIYCVTTWSFANIDELRQFYREI